MRRTAALFIALALVVSACGGSKKPVSDPTAPADHTQIAAQRAVLVKALAAFKRAASGTYESEVTADGVNQPLAHETGSYRLQPAAASFERAIQGIDEISKKIRVQIVRVRATAHGLWFLQLKEWGNWTGCWLPTDLPEITKLTGVARARNSPLPTAVWILAKATVVAAGGGLDTPHLAVDAYSAMRFLGIAEPAIADERAALSKTLVPVLLDVTADGAPSGAAVEGPQVVAALGAAGARVSSKLAAFVSKTHARVILGDLGKPVTISAPPTAELLPRHPASTTTCPANR